MKYEVFVLLPGYETNTYLVWDETSKEAALIDPANESSHLAEFIISESLKVKYIINTHGHADHIGGNSYFQKLYSGAKLAIHQLDASSLACSRSNLSEFIGSPVISPEPDMILEDGDVLFLGKNEMKIIHCPGHTQGGITVYTGNLLFSGDSLFDHEIGRTDLPGGDYDTLISSINKKLFTLPGDTIVLPGHGPASTIKIEKLENPYAGIASRY